MFPYPKKLDQAADEIFRVAAWTRSELALSGVGCGGQVDAEKLAQRSSVAPSQQSPIAITLNFWLWGV
jgi:hypothetical protein